MSRRAVADVIAYALATSGADSNSGKYFFANATTDGKTPVSDQAAAILADEHGVTDVFGVAYGRPRGGPGADAYGDSRPFQTEPHFAAIAGPDYFNVPSDNVVYNRGPAMNLVDSPSFPSGHTTYGYTGALLLALLTPERYRADDRARRRIRRRPHHRRRALRDGRDRRRTLATYDVAHLIANDPAYLGQTLKGAPAIADFPAALKAARADLVAALQAGCGDTIAALRARRHRPVQRCRGERGLRRRDADLRPAGRLSQGRRGRGKTSPSSPPKRAICSPSRFRR